MLQCGGLRPGFCAAQGTKNASFASAIAGKRQSRLGAASGTQVGATSGRETRGPRSIPELVERNRESHRARGHGGNPTNRRGRPGPVAGGAMCRCSRRARPRGPRSRSSRGCCGTARTLSQAPIKAGALLCARRLAPLVGGGAATNRGTAPCRCRDLWLSERTATHPPACPPRPHGPLTRAPVPAAALAPAPAASAPPLTPPPLQTPRSLSGRARARLRAAASR
jgi:hypothetical protein